MYTLASRTSAVHNVLVLESDSVDASTPTCVLPPMAHLFSERCKFVAHVTSVLSTRIRLKTKHNFESCRRIHLSSC